MNIGIFDSGLGGLFMMKAVVEALPQYNYVYLGDTQRVPYGNRSPETVYEFLLEAVRYLFVQKNCALIIVACNTASAEALRKIQQDYLLATYPERRVLGVIVPTAEIAAEKNIQRVGVMATEGTVQSKTFVREFQKLNPGIEVFQEAAPLLASLIENNGMEWVSPILEKHIRSLERHSIKALVLGCTHYAVVKTKIRELLHKDILLICQDDLVPDKLKQYLERHPEIETKLEKRASREFLVTDKTHVLQEKAGEWFGKDAKLQRVNISSQQDA